MTLLALVGPTASGKTEAGVRVAEALGAEILCVDSMSVYRGLDVATTKPTPAQRAAVRHHLIDLVEIGEPFSVAEFARQARQAIEDLGGRGKVPLLVGGSGLYYRAVVDRLAFPATDRRTRSILEAESEALGPARLHARLFGFDPHAAGRIDPSNARRTIRALEVAAITGRRLSDFFVRWERFDPRAVRAAGVRLPREVLHRRIERRATELVPLLLEEARRLLDANGRLPVLSSAAIGYAQAAACLDGKLSRDALEWMIVRQHKALARRQMAWFVRDPRIRWFDAGEAGAAEVSEQVTEYLGNVLAPGGTGATMMIGKGSSPYPSVRDRSVPEEV